MENIDKSIYDDAIGDALFEVKKESSYSCGDILSYLYCGKCYYKILYSEYEGIMFNNLDDEKNITLEQYEILFYDIVPEVDQIYSYLFDDQSSYRIVRFSDGQVVLDHKIIEKNKVLKRLYNKKDYT